MSGSRESRSGSGEVAWLKRMEAMAWGMEPRISTCVSLFLCEPHTYKGGLFGLGNLETMTASPCFCWDGQFEFNGTWNW